MLALIPSLLVLTQDPPPAPAASPPSDVAISVNARADSVRWRQTGSVTVRAWSEPSGAVIEENLSTGLPRPIPGQRTFRNVGWTLRAAASLTGPGAAPPPTEDVPSQEPAERKR
ncbi:MAG TPA: hypothetical protein VGR32_04410 [Brevundimonas sp.]|jgi:hypothetical protein|uniref:hypothetical protein n=1 Tax=Brevundimonas sp. TaxID=1871086 RepID=UPI002DF00C48|nr:hypothetical protein [Brevundimonas sp.]